MEQWTKQTLDIINAHTGITSGAYTSVMSKAGGFDKYVKSLGGVFAKWHGVTTPVKTVSEFRERCEYVQGLMAIWHFCYWNGKTWYYWKNSASKAFYSTKQTKSCPSGTIAELCTGASGKTRITNCNYGVDTLTKALGVPKWTRSYTKMIAAGAKKITDKSKLQVGDLVHFFRGSASNDANWRHVAIVWSVDDGEIVLADFGSRFITSGNPHHKFPADYSTYGNNWFGVHWLDLQKEEVTPMLNGVDISSYQSGIDFSKVPADFVIIKATEGTGYVNPDCNRAYANAKANNKLLGLYHYANGTNAVLEADHFLDTIKNYIGTAILALDWESRGNVAFGKSDISWCKAWLDRVYAKTGIRPLIYMSQSVTNAHDWSSIAKDYGLWVAQYVVGSRSSYSQEYSHGITGAWQSAAIFQYTSGGYLSGWSGKLDLDVAYMTKTAWSKYAQTEQEVVPVPRTIKQGNTGKVVRIWQEILGSVKVDGKFGTKTKDATVKWQKGKGLTQDGVVGPKTWAVALKSLQ